MKRSVLPCIMFFLLAVNLLSVTYAQNSLPYFTPSAVDTYDNSTWSGLIIGKTSRKDITDRFWTGKSNIKNALKLTQPESSTMKIDVVFSGKKSSSPLSVIVLSFESCAPSVSGLEKLTGLPAENRYAAGRRDDWRIALFQQKGIAALVQTVNGRDIVQSVILTTPDRLQSLAALSIDPTQIDESPDSRASEPRVMEFGNVSAKINYWGQNTPSESAKFRVSEMFIEKQLRAADAYGSIRYRSNAEGIYRVYVTINWNKNDGGDIRVECELKGKGPFGMIRETSSETKSLSKSSQSFDFNTELNFAMTRVEKAFKKKMDKQGPPSLDQLRSDAWRKFVEETGSTAVKH